MCPPPPPPPPSWGSASSSLAACALPAIFLQGTQARQERHVAQGSTQAPPPLPPERRPGLLPNESAAAMLPKTFLRMSCAMQGQRVNQERPPPPRSDISLPCHSRIVATFYLISTKFYHILLSFTLCGTKFYRLPFIHPVQWQHSIWPALVSMVGWSRFTDVSKVGGILCIWHICHTSEERRGES